MSEGFLEVARYRVLFADCDPMRIMYYAGYFRLFEIGRAELFRRLGRPFPGYVEQGLYLGVIEATCRYKRPARYDEELLIHAAIAELGRARMEIAYEVARAADRELLVSGSTVHAVMDESGKPQRIPQDFREAALGALLPRARAEA